MEALTRQKIEETVVEILKKADMEEMTEFKVRVMASTQLGIDLSGIEHKKCIRSLVESFLLSSIEEEETCNGIEPNSQQTQFQKQVNGCGDQLTNNRSVVVQDLEGTALLSIRESSQKHGKQIPGISMTSEQWAVSRNNVPAIEKAVVKMQSKLRSELEENEDASNSMKRHHKYTPARPQKDTQQKICSQPTRPNPCQPSTSSSPLVPPSQPDRLYGKNYMDWAQEMNIFLKQLKIAYVLTDPCPDLTPSLQSRSNEILRLKAAEQKWVDDDHICHRHILNSLCDHLYYQYSKKKQSAKEVWDALKLVYGEFGAKRCQVKKYIEFEIVDEKPIVEQVVELNHVADCVVNSGIPIDENFHVSVVVSKLPRGWKDLCMRLMHKEYLTFKMLMDLIKAEEEDKQGEGFKLIDPGVATNSGPMWRKMEKRRREMEIDSKSREKGGHVCNKRRV